MPHHDEYFDTLVDKRLSTASVSRIFRVFDFIHAGVTLNVIGNSEDELLLRRDKVQELLLNSEMNKYLLVDNDIFQQLIEYPEWQIHYRMLTMGEDIVKLTELIRKVKKD